jgi:hypothetical protein
MESGQEISLPGLLTPRTGLLHFKAPLSDAERHSERHDLWQFGSSISFGFGRHAIVTGTVRWPHSSVFGRHDEVV